MLNITDEYAPVSDGLKRRKMEAKPKAKASEPDHATQARLFLRSLSEEERMKFLGECAGNSSRACAAQEDGLMGNEEGDCGGGWEVVLRHRESRKQNKKVSLKSPGARSHPGEGLNMFESSLGRAGPRHSKWRLFFFFYIFHGLLPRPQCSVGRNGWAHLPLVQLPQSVPQLEKRWSLALLVMVQVPSTAAARDGATARHLLRKVRRCLPHQDRGVHSLPHEEDDDGRPGRNAQIPVAREVGTVDRDGRAAAPEGTVLQAGVGSCALNSKNSAE